MSAGQFPEMDAYQIAERLLYVVRAAKSEDLFTGASAVDLFLAIQHGVSTMVKEERTSGDDVKEAEDNLRILLAEMDLARESLGVSAFQERTVSMALRKLCPPGFWPFC